MYCPECGAEYRPGFTTCADCRVDLVEEPPNPGSPGSPAWERPSIDREDFVVVLESVDPHDLKCAQERLEDQEIPAIVRQGAPLADGYSALFGQGKHEGLVPLLLLVPSPFENAARTALEDFLEDPAGDEEPRFAELPPELAGGDEPLPGELEDDELLRAFEEGTEEPSPPAHQEDHEEDDAPGIFCGFCGAEVKPDGYDRETGYATCPECQRTFQLDDGPDL